MIARTAIDSQAERGKREKVMPGRESFSVSFLLIMLRSEVVD